MYCKKCGAELNEGAAFCKKCGTPIGAEQNENDTPATTSKDSLDNGGSNKARNKKRSHVVFKIITTVFVIAVLLIGIVLATDYFDVVDYKPILNKIDSLSNDEKNMNPSVSNSDIEKKSNDLDKDSMSVESEAMMNIGENTYKVEPIDADKYFNENGTIEDKKNVLESEYVQTEQEAAADYEDRGFDVNEITYDFSMLGEYIGETSINPASSDKHPEYELTYYTPDGDCWVVLSLNGQIIAFPFWYNLQSGRETKAQIYISERPSITCYDNESNMFYEMYPDASMLEVKIVSRIDTSTLDSLSGIELDNL